MCLCRGAWWVLSPELEASAASRQHLLSGDNNLARSEPRSISSDSNVPRSKSRTSANGEGIGRSIQELLQSHLRGQVFRRVPQAWKVSPRTASVLKQGLTSSDRSARPLGTKASRPVPPIGVGYLRPISLGVLSDVQIVHGFHCRIVFKARLSSLTDLVSIVGKRTEQR